MLLSLLFLVAGTFFLPAVLLTTTTSGHIFNLRPDRLIGVIRASGRRYRLVFASFLVAIIFYAWTVFGSTWFPESTHLGDRTLVRFLEGRLAFLPLLAMGVYAGHVACYELGLLYREHHERFDWILQRHVPMRLRERVTAQRENAAALKAEREARRQARRARGLTY